ncbi:MAG: flavodoxin-like domain-containing protein [Candidatus Thorarchaeota archaeon]|nr:flavodoxin-like domain-containing protein [Candidatus Thorarchaeota archaeon]
MPHIMVKAVIVYDTKYGNTKLIAEAIKQGMESAGLSDVLVTSIEGTHTGDLARYDVVIFGCPNHNQGPSLTMQKHIERVATVGLSGKTGAAFDTYQGHNMGIAVKKLENMIRQRLPGIRLLVEGFSAKVESRTGPLVSGEINRASEFGVRIVQTLMKL